MIIAQRMRVPKERIPEMVASFRSHGYEIGNYQSDLLNHIAFDTSNEELLSFFRFECSAAGDMIGLISVSTDDAGLLDVLEVVYPFVEGDSYVLTTGQHQCELEGYYMLQNGVYKAKNIQVISERGQKIS